MNERSKQLSGYSPLVSTLLEKRGITTDVDASIFLDPDYERDTHDPMLLSGMNDAIDRIIRALDDDENIRIVSDFDADGIPAAVIMNDVFAKLGAKNFSVTIPHRNTEGFGLNDRIVDECIESDVKLLVTLDCGMGDGARIAPARGAGIDVIIIDHHRPDEANVPDCIIVNPNLPDDPYPNKHLCGAGVAYKVVQALLDTLRRSLTANPARGGAGSQQLKAIPVGWEKWLLDMVGIATLSDMVQLVGENRALARYGLLVLRKSQRPGIRALCRRTRLRQSTITEDDVVFTITPRINAASRMDEPEAAFRLLSATSESESDELAEHLDGVNNARKGAVAAMTREINKMLSDRDLPSVIVVGNTHWRPGLLGLAAHRITETYDRPAFVWGQGEASTVKGSCRSNGHFDVMVLMTEAREHFVEFGGHKHSGGFSTTVRQVVSLEEALSKAADALDSVDAEETPTHDMVLDLAHVNEKTLLDIEQLAPFGAGNKKPIFLFNDCAVANAEPFGKEKQHTRLTLGDVQAIQFFSKEDIKAIKARDVVSLLASIERDTFSRGMPVRLRIVDLVQ